MKSSLWIIFLISCGQLHYNYISPSCLSVLGSAVVWLVVSGTPPCYLKLVPASCLPPIKHKTPSNTKGKTVLFLHFYILTSSYLHCTHCYSIDNVPRWQKLNNYHINIYLNITKTITIIFILCKDDEYNSSLICYAKKSICKYLLKHVVN